MDSSLLFEENVPISIAVRTSERGWTNTKIAAAKRTKVIPATDKNAMRNDASVPRTAIEAFSVMLLDLN